MKLKEVLGFNASNWQDKSTKIKSRCNYCKKKLKIEETTVVFLFKYDNNWKMLFEFKFICDDCIKALSMPTKTLFK